MKTSKNLLWYIEWASTLLIIFATLLLNANHIDGAVEVSKWIYASGAFGWLIVGILWRKTSIVLINLVLIIIFIVGKVVS